MEEEDEDMSLANSVGNEPLDSIRNLPDSANNDMNTDERSLAQEKSPEQMDQDASEITSCMVEDEELTGSQSSIEVIANQSQSSSSSESIRWISWYVSGLGREFFTEVSEDFIEDDFNLTGLSSMVPLYKQALEVILDIDTQQDYANIPDASLIESSAELLYGLIHQRFIISRNGIYQMAEKYEKGDFGYCPRTYCKQCPVVPCGLSDLPGVDTVKIFCPSCLDVYVPPQSRFQNVDGAFFGTTFPHLFFQTYQELKPAIPKSGLPIYVSKIFGFRISSRSKISPKMTWLRSCIKGDEDDDLSIHSEAQTSQSEL